MKINPALYFCIGVITFVLLIDFLFSMGILPGGTITQGVEKIYKTYPWIRWIYWGLAVFFDWHFFGK